MIFTLNADEWLGQVDPWCIREAAELLQAIEQRRSVGLFECAATADGSRWYVMAPHADNVLLLPSLAAWRALVGEVMRRFGLRSTLPLARDTETSERAVNDSAIMPLLDQA